MRTLSIITTALLALALTACGSKTSPAHQDLDASVKYRLDGMEIWIPLRYHIWARTKYQQWPEPKPHASDVKAFDFSVLLPDFEPFSEENRSEFLGNDSHRRLDVLVHGREFQPSITMDEYLRLILGRGREEVSDLPGLQRFSDSVASGPKKPNDVYLMNGSKRYFRMVCAREGLNPRCAVFSVRKDGLVLEYRYSREFAKNWRSIDLSVNQLIDRFKRTQ